MEMTLNNKPILLILMHDRWNVKTVKSVVLSQISVTAYSSILLFVLLIIGSQKTQRVTQSRSQSALSCIRRQRREKLFLRRLMTAGYLANGIPTLDRRV